jgi:hypothetical protein
LGTSSKPTVSKTSGNGSLGRSATKGISRAQRELAEQLFREKRERRKRLAALPIEEKIRILVQMQKLSNDIREKTGRKPLPVWVIEP